MVVPIRFKDLWGKIQVPTGDDEFPYQDFSPRTLKSFGVICFLCAAASTVLLISLGLDIAEHLNDNLTLLNIGIALGVAFLAVGAVVLFVVLGARLVQGKSDGGELLAIVTVALVCVSFLAMMLLYGLSWLHIIYIAELVFLAIVTVYMDPELSQERLLSKHAAKLPPAERRNFEKKVDQRRPLKGYITLNFFNLFWIFVACSVLGLAIETLFHLAIYHEYQDRAGLLYGPFSPIYGFGGLLMTVALNRFHDKPIPLIFLVSALIGGCFEFFVSWIMQYAFGIVAWDYSGTFLSIDGRTNFMFMCFWGLLGVMWIKLLLPILLWGINKIPWKIRYALTSVCAALLFVDVVMTVQTIDCWYLREAGHAPAPGIEEFIAQHYDNEYMRERFQTMSMNPDQASRLG